MSAEVIAHAGRSTISAIVPPVTVPTARLRATLHGIEEDLETVNTIRRRLMEQRDDVLLAMGEAEEAGELTGPVRPCCPVCGRRGTCVSGKVIAGYDPHTTAQRSRRYWWCARCDTRVGTHGDTSVPLGTMADVATREARAVAHAAFDPLWRDGVIGTRSDAYEWLASMLGVPVQQAHIAMFDREQCDRVAALCRQRVAAEAAVRRGAVA